MYMYIGGCLVIIPHCQCVGGIAAVTHEFCIMSTTTSCKLAYMFHDVCEFTVYANL